MTSQARSNPIRRLSRLPRHWLSAPVLWGALGLISLILALGIGYVFTGQPVTMVIDDQSYPVRVHRLTVKGALEELGLTPKSEDIITPPIGTHLVPNQTISIKLARPVMVEVDGRKMEWLTQEETVGRVLAEVRLSANARDEIWVNGTIASMEEMLPTPPVVSPTGQELDAASLVLMDRTPRGAIALARPEVVNLAVFRAILVTLNDDGISSTFYTARSTVGEALREQGLTIYGGDKVTPSLDTPLLPGMRIYIQRSAPVTITVDGRIIQTRTLRETVGEVLVQEGIALMGQDYSDPPLELQIAANEAIEIVRVRETFEIEQEFIPYETTWIPDPEMALDRQEIRQQGVTGVIKTRTRVRTENGYELWREIEDEWLDQEPSDRIIAYGTQITVRTLETEQGAIEYWRKISMLATPYKAASSGKDPDHPRYGITRAGLWAGYGIVAVDPKVIPLMTDLYIPDYGRAVAGDTGSLILGKRVDLGFDDDQPLPNIYEWRDVYVLTPVPPLDKIRYVLPEWPQRP